MVRVHHGDLAHDMLDLMARVVQHRVANPHAPLLVLSASFNPITMAPHARERAQALYLEPLIHCLTNAHWHPDSANHVWVGPT